MVARLKSAFPGKAAVTNLSDIGIKGGCLGCIRCGYDNRCVYEGKDGFIDFFRETLEKADVLIFAGAMRDRYLSAAWKTFFDRSFFKNHTPSLVGKPIGWLISGPLSLVPNLRQIIEAYVELKQGSLAGIVTDEAGESSLTDRLIDGLAERLIAYGAAGYAGPATFLGVGGRKIFRDDIYARLRFPFQADHRYYKKSGFYDFPHKDVKGRLTSAFLMLLTRIPSVRKDIYNKRMIAEMVKPLKNLVDRMT
jgi:hypothetical protein